MIDLMEGFFLFFVFQVHLSTLTSTYHWLFFSFPFLVPIDLLDLCVHLVTISDVSLMVVITYLSVFPESYACL